VSTDDATDADGDDEMVDQQDQPDQITLLDLLYAVVATDLGMRVNAADLSQFSCADWSTIALVGSVIILSWIGFHKNRTAVYSERKPVGSMNFCSPRFAQFMASVVVVVLYFAMGIQLSLPGKDNPSPPALDVREERMALMLLLIFGAYVIWDLLDIVEANIANSSDWRKRAAKGALVTAAFLLLFALVWGGTYWLFGAAVPGVWLIFGINVVLILCLWFFRVAQDTWGNTAS
jgi:hypothetical protein